MGRIRGKWIKKISEKLVEQYPDKVSNNFEDNKKFLDELKIINDKLMRNKVAGYIVVLVEKKKVE